MPHTGWNDEKVNQISMWLFLIVTTHCRKQSKKNLEDQLTKKTIFEKFTFTFYTSILLLDHLLGKTQTSDLGEVDESRPEGNELIFE